MDIKKNPPCTPKCPARGIGCHSGCEKYAAWKAALEDIAKECRRESEAVQGVAELKRQRQEWLRRKGYSKTGGAR